MCLGLGICCWSPRASTWLGCFGLPCTMLGWASSLGGVPHYMGVVPMPLVRRTCLFPKTVGKCEEVARVWAVFATASAAKLWCHPEQVRFAKMWYLSGPGLGLDSAKRPVLCQKRGVWQNLVATQGLRRAKGDLGRQPSHRTPPPTVRKTTMVTSKVTSSAKPSHRAPPPR